MLSKQITPTANQTLDFTPKIIFFDIDDTLSRGGIIAPQNKATLEALACKTDIKLVIATGRAKPMLPDDILELHDCGVIDAIICMNGQYSYRKTDPHSQDKEELIRHYPLTRAQAEQIVTLCQQEQVIFKFESTEHIAWSVDNEYVRKFISENHDFVIDPEFYKTNDVYQCSVFFANEEEKLQHVDFASMGLKLVHWHDVGADILPIDASKARAVKDVCDFYDIDVCEAMAFGDGFNDLEMFDLVGCSVAMGDGQPALIERADIVTGSIEEFGIQAVLDRFMV